MQNPQKKLDYTIDFTGVLKDDKLFWESSNQQNRVAEKGVMVLEEKEIAPQTGSLTTTSSGRIISSQTLTASAGKSVAFATTRASNLRLPARAPKARPQSSEALVLRYSCFSSPAGCSAWRLRLGR